MGKPINIEGIADNMTGFRKLDFNIKQKLVYISNDSSQSDMVVNFDGTIEQGGSFTVKAGESISDVPMNCSSISIGTLVSGATVPFRVMGV